MNPAITRETVPSNDQEIKGLNNKLVVEELMVAIADMKEYMLDAVDKTTLELEKLAKTTLVLILILIVVATRYIWSCNFNYNKSKYIKTSS